MRSEGWHSSGQGKLSAENYTAATIPQGRPDECVAFPSSVFPPPSPTICKMGQSWISFVQRTKQVNILLAIRLSSKCEFIFHFSPFSSLFSFYPASFPWAHQYTHPPPIHLPTYTHTHSSTRPPTYLSIHLLTLHSSNPPFIYHQCIYSFIYTPTHPFIHPSVCLPLFH